MASILWAVNLNCIVRQVDKVVVEVLRRHVVGLRGSAEIALLEEIDLVVLGHGDPDSDVELPFVDQQGSLYILLNNEGLRANLRFLVAWLAPTGGGLVLCCFSSLFLHQDGLRLDWELCCVLACSLVRLFL